MKGKEKQQHNKYNEIREEDRLTLTKQKFLERPITRDSELVEKSAGYSIEDEFGKTRKNKSFLFYFIFVGFLGLLVVGTYLLAAVINQGHRTALGIDTYQGMQLRELLEKSRNAQSRLKSAEQQRSSLKEELQRKIVSLQKQSIEDVKKINQKAQLSAKERLRQVKAREAFLKKEIAAVKKEYQGKIRDLRGKIRKLKKEVASTKTNVDKGISQTKQIVDNYRRLHSLRLNKQLQEFNPVFRSARLRRILKGKNEFLSNEYPDLIGYQRSFSIGGMITENHYRERLQNIKDRDRLMLRLLKIPYLNSIPNALERMHSLNKSINKEYEKTWYKLYLHLREREHLLNSYRYALASLGSEQGEVGYILDARNTKKILVHIGTIFRPRAGTIAYVFQEAEEYIAKIKLFPTISGYGNYRAVLVDLVSKKKVIKPFDRLLLSRREEVKEEVLESVEQSSNKTGDDKNNNASATKNEKVE